jgi:glycosyltransferase involved in cell wall biosynthesis
MRILIADKHRHVVGGTQTYTRALFEELRARGHELALAFEFPGEEAHEVVDGRDPAHLRLCLQEIGERAALDAITAFRPDVVYAHGLRTAVFERALQARYPALLFAHDYRGMCITGSKHHARPHSRPCERVLGPACIALNYPAGCGARSPRTLLRLYDLQRDTLDTLRGYRRVLVASRHMREQLGRHGVPASSVEILPLFPPMAPAPELPPAPEANGVVLFIGRLTELKGPGMLVEAIGPAERALGRPLTAVFVGDGPEQGKLEAQVRAAGVRARFLGWLEAAAVAREIRGAELLAVPSVWPEPFGLVGLEAGGLGVPSVGFRVGGIPDWLRAGESGELASGDPPRASDLGAAIVRALRDRSHYVRLSEGAWRVAGEYTRSAHLTRIEQILHDVAGK